MLLSVIMVLYFMASTAGDQTLQSVKLIGDEVVFECSNATAVRWDHKPLNEPIATIHNGQKLVPSRAGRFDVVFDNATSTSSMTIKNISSRDAGQYRCVTNQGSVNKLVVDLTVLVERPRCFVNLTHNSTVLNEGDSVVIDCMVCRKGTSAPEIACHSDSVLEPPRSSDTADGGSVNDATCENSRTAFVVHWRYHRSSFSCNFSFGKSSAAETSFIWKSGSLSVNYGPRDVTIEPQTQTMFVHGSALHCKADSNPASSYQWVADRFVWFGGEFVVDVCALMASKKNGNDHGILTINDTMMSLSLVCNALYERSSTFGDSKQQPNQRKKISVVITDVDRQRCSPPSPPPGLNVAVVVGIIAFSVVVVVVATAVICVKHRPHRANEEIDDRHSNRRRSAPAVHPSQAVDGYEEIQEFNQSSVDPVVYEVETRQKPYQDLSTEHMEIPARPSIYRQLSHAPNVSEAGYLSTIPY